MADTTAGRLASHQNRLMLTSMNHMAPDELEAVKQRLDTLGAVNADVNEDGRSMEGRMKSEFCDKLENTT